MWEIFPTIEMMEYKVHINNTSSGQALISIRIVRNNCGRGDPGNDKILLSGRYLSLKD